jgi:hypothetical protein
MGRNPSKEEIMNPNVVVFFVPIVAIISVFTMIIFSIRYGSQRKEREAFYKAETLRRITESSGEGAKAAIDLMREEERLKRIKSREGMKIGGLVCIGVGIGLTVFLLPLVGAPQGSPYMVGLIPGLIGVALLVYVFFMAPPVE